MQLMHVRYFHMISVQKRTFYIREAGAAEKEGESQAVQANLLLLLALKF